MDFEVIENTGKDGSVKERLRGQFLQQMMLESLVKGKNNED